MKKEIKDTIITDLGSKLKEFPHFYLVDVSGLNAESTSSLRRKCFNSEIKMVVVKNNLLLKAFEASDVDYEPLYGSLKGNTAVMFCQTANIVAKLLKEYTKEGIPALKSKNELIADVVALLQSPVKNVSSALQSSANTIHGLLKTLGERPE